jgi:sigma-B regulation protein RsbU (phosphoserine phosphatase)
LQPGDGIFVVSDGVIEAMNSVGELYTLDRLNAELNASIAASASELVESVIKSVHSFAGAAPKADDLTILALRWRPAGAA